MASNPVDPLQTLQAALSTEQNSKEQADLLGSLRESLEAQPAPIRVLVPILISKVVNAGDSLLKSWVIDLFHFGLCRSSLSLDAKTQLSSQTLETLLQLLDDPNPSIVKVTIQCLTAVYPLLFRLLCSTRNNPPMWTTLSNCKSKAIAFVTLPGIHTGLRISGLKFIQRVILVQVPQGISDPRLQNKNDPNLSFCPANHPFISLPQLEAEGQGLLKKVIEILYSNQSVDILTALLNSWVTLVKMRPNMIPLVVTSLKQWTPAALHGLSATTIKSAEKAVRIVLVHISRIPNAGQYVPQINEALAVQASRMEAAAAEEKKRRAAIAAGVTEPKKRSSTETDRSDNKRVKLENGVADAPPPPPPPPDPSLSLLASFDFSTLPATLITDLIVANLEAFTEPALIALVQAYRQRMGLATASTSAAVLPPPLAPAPEPAPVPAPTADSRRNIIEPIPRPHTPPPPVKEEPVDPLQMDIDQDDLEYEPDRLNEELSVPAAISEEVIPEPDNARGFDEKSIISLSDFKLPSPKALGSTDDRIDLISKSIARIYDDAVELRTSTGATVTVDTTIGGPLDMWMLLVVRMITRVAEPPKELDESPSEEGNAMEDEERNITLFYERQDRLRKTLCAYIMSDFSGRIRLATTWMNEEWYNDQVRQERNMKWRPNYDVWLGQIVAAYQTHLDGKDRTFTRFLLDLPSVPADVLSLLRELCVENNSPDKMQIGFSTLRGFVIQRPLMRAEALNVLLELTTHPEKKVRGAAINTVKLWVPNHQPMYSMIREFALQILRKLQKVSVKRPEAPEPDGDVILTNGDVNVDGERETRMKVAEEDKGADDEGEKPPLADEEEGERMENMEDGQLPVEDLIQTLYLPERIELPADKSHVLQHVELLFALSVKVPDLLDDLFAAYDQMDITVQEAIQELITALVRSLGSSHGKLLTLMRTCPPGAESLALRILTIFTEHGRPSPQLVALVKGLINERDLDARFLIPIIAEMDKPDIIRHLPRIVSILNSQPENKNLVRSVFGSIVATPPQTFGSVTSNMPRIRQSELLTPAELMILLHDSEKEIGIKSAKEAIGICFSMTDVFRSEILAAVMQQIMDEPVLPVLFLRTVIQAVTTYKTLVKFVSTTLLSRLITKKIWTNPLLWEGFIHCAKVIAPASFAALLQLPKDQLRELLVTRVFEKAQLAKRALREIVLLRHLANHENITGLIDVDAISPDFDEVYIFMEPMEADLHQIIKSGQHLTSEHVQYFLYQILRGMKYVHSAHIIHRDLKPGNLLVNADCELKICDFGLSRGFDAVPDENASHLTEYVATRWYRAPEIMLAFKRYNTAIDVWSIGCIFAELLMVDQLNKILNVLGTPDDPVIRKIGSDKAQAYVKSLPLKKTVPLIRVIPQADVQALDLLKRMLSFDPDERITIPEALEHPWLASYHDIADEPECTKPFDKWRKIEALDTIDDFRSALWNEIQDYRREVRGVHDLSGMPIRKVSGSRGSDIEERATGAWDHPLDAGAIADETVSSQSRTLTEEPAEIELDPAKHEDKDIFTAPPSSNNVPVTSADPVVSYARRSSIMQPIRQGSTFSTPFPSSQHVASYSESSVTFPSRGEAYVVPARSRTGSIAGGGEVGGRRLLRTLSTVSIYESAEGLAGGLADLAPIGKYIVDRQTTGADAPASEMPRDFGIDEETEEDMYTSDRREKKDGKFFIGGGQKEKASGTISILIRGLSVLVPQAISVSHRDTPNTTVSRTHSQNTSDPPSPKNSGSDPHVHSIEEKGTETLE
ncbi:hypothetical protein D9757_004811 [Collybiopsis confluens]|uniref:mitogen-activated protein kinase n=1 Tax=Collybiopsis confluens TaxID=2823264 RepID=A0A8H5HSE5_9AGAR|nr:hypothetical protein D9757_004811 [Collybiopsis confluens]